MGNTKISAWEKVEIARDPKRKTSLDYIEEIFDDFIELHGDRNAKDDKAIVCGLAQIEKQNFTIIAEQKGRTTKENIERNFGMPNPESYRKAIRFMKMPLSGASNFRKFWMMTVISLVLMLSLAIRRISSYRKWVQKVMLWKK